MWEEQNKMVMQLKYKGKNSQCKNKKNNNEVVKYESEENSFISYEFLSEMTHS
jgi:hypothetical protein